MRKTGLRVKAGGGGRKAPALNSRWRKFKGHLKEECWNLIPFVLGLLLATLYGVMGLLVEGQPLWFCFGATLLLALLASFGMGLSAGVRADVAVMLPSLFSAHGRNFLLFLFVVMVLAGPLTNTLENKKRAASSLVCGAELAANQTQELIKRSTAPISSMLNKIREITSNAHSVVGRVQKFTDTLTDSVHHVSRTLRNVLHFLVDIGDICNAKLGSPYRKCQNELSNAWKECSNLLGDFDFLCNIIDSVLPLCNLARAGELFCVIPSYVASHLKKRLAEPVVKAFEQMKREFDFSIWASVNFELEANFSRSLQQMSQGIMAEVSSELQLFEKFSDLFKYCSIILVFCSFMGAKKYRCKYLSELDFDNIYITAEFKELDQQVASQGRPSVLPLTRGEARTYITPSSFQLTAGEKQGVMMGMLSVFKYLTMGGLLMALDFLLFWTLDQVHHQVKGGVVARAPVLVMVQVNGSGYASDIYRDLVAAFNILQGGNISVISTKCLLVLSEPNYRTYFSLGFLLGLALLVSLTGGFVQRSRRVICALHHPERERERIQFLYQKILDERRTLGSALRRSAVRSPNGRGEGEERGCLHTLLPWFPGGVQLSVLLGLSPTVLCRACGEVAGPEKEEIVACSMSPCPGRFCRPCFLSLGNTCLVCTPLEGSEEEQDSSDEQQGGAHNTDPQLRFCPGPGSVVVDLK